MADTIQVYNLGEGGVNVDKNPTRTADNETLLSQNATYDATLERLGALCKRPGLDRFTNVPTDGAVLGGIEAPYRGTAGAPASGGGGGGSVGDSGGTGQAGQGEGIGPGDDTGVGGGASLGGSVFTGGVSTIFGGTRLILVGRQSSSSGQGWYLTDQGFADGAWRIDGSSAIGTPQGQHNTAFPDTAGNASPAVIPMVISSGGDLYYQADIPNQTAAVAPVLPVIRRLWRDGTSDVAVFTIPDNAAVLALSSPAPSHLISVTCMQKEYGSGDAIWISVFDKVTSGGSAGDYGRVLRVGGLDSGSYSVEEVYNTLTAPLGIATASVPFCLENFLGFMWMGIWHGSNAANPSIHRIIPTATGWTIDKSQTFGTPATGADTTCMKVYNGVLYVGVQSRDPAVGFATVWAYPPDVAPSVSLTGSGGTAQDPSGFVSLEVFQNKLYATYCADSQASKIYQFDGTTWTAVYTAATVSLKQIGLMLRVDGSYIYAYGGTFNDTNNSFLVSTDGTTWTEKRTKMIGNNGHGDLGSSNPLGVFFGIDQ